MPIIPKLNLKAAVRINDAALSSVAHHQEPVPKPISNEPPPESIVVESQTGNVKVVSSGDERSPPPSDDYDYDDDNQFKSPPPCLLNTQFRVELTEEDDSRTLNSPKSAEHNTSTLDRLADIVNNDHGEASLQSFSDVDSISEHSIQSDTSYTREALQIVANTSNKQLNNFSVLKEPSSPSAASDTTATNAPSRKRRRAISKLTEDPTKLPLCDLLFYNPPPTIFQSKAQEDLNNNETATKKILPQKKRRSSRSSSVASEASVKSGNGLIEFDDDIKSGDENSEKDISNNNIGDGNEPVLTIDESGNIVVKNPNSLDDGKDKKPEAKMKSSTTYSSFRRRERSKNIWNTEETGMFYTALEIVGTDFSLMEAVFFKDRGRSRKQLKQKFKREEKVNRDYIDSILYKSLRNRSKLNAHLLQTAAGEGAISTDDGPTVASPEVNSVVLQSA